MAAEQHPELRFYDTRKGFLALDEAKAEIEARR